MVILGLDTSDAAVAAALWQDGTVLASERLPMVQGHAEALLPLVMRVFDAAGLSLGALGAVGVVVGPGSFTGLRIGIAAARGLTLAKGLPVLGIGTGEAVRAGLPAELQTSHTVAVATRSRRGDLFLEIFGPDGTVVPAQSLEAGAAAASLSAFPHCVLAGSAAAAVAACGSTPVPFVGHEHIDPGVVATLAAAQVKDGRLVPALPVYVRPPDVTLSLARAPCGT